MKYIIRIDDITPRMNHCNFNILKDEWNISSDLSVNYIGKFIKN